ncbi:MAG: hypothetical protein LBK47_01090 [Prevotellaceae bacterium]|jgi:hypothetical protein|nr:hypothetical protein [Prevotellaceae bacterium]
MDNRHAKTVPQNAIDQVKSHLTEAKKLLEPYCPTLTVEQRRSLPKMSDGTLAFGEKSLQHATNHPEFLPAHISLDEWKIDMADVTNLKQLMALLSDLDQLVGDTRLAAGNEAYFAGRGYYHNVQRAAADGIQGAKPIYDDLKTHFRSKATRAGSADK